MNCFPQLRCRSEFSFRAAYGPLDAVAARLAALGAPAAGLVDSGGTWGHVRWQKALAAVGVEPLFGAEFPVEVGERKPLAWALAEDTRAFYRWTSAHPKTPEDWTAPGIVRFAGCALTDPATFDYVDLNPASRLAARHSVELARLTGKPLVLTSDNRMPGPEDAGRFLAICDDKQITPQWLLTEDELRAELGWLPPEVLDAAVRGTREVAERLAGRRLPVAPIIRVEGDLDALVEAGRQYRLGAGHLAAWTPEYEARLQREMEMIRLKEFESYFIVVADLVTWAKERMLVGPARGSSAGSLVCYLLRITEVDPLPHGLLFERFIDINRNDLPDIDIDFNDRKRELCFEYLAEKYGAENVARIGNVSSLKPRSVMAEVGKRMGVPASATFSVINALIEYSSGDSRYGKGLEDTIANTQPGREFAARYPEAMVMGDVENHAWHTSVHAAGIIVSNEPVVEYATVRDGVVQLDKKDCETLNLLKIDALGLTTLGIIEDTGCVTAEELYALPLNDPEVFKVFNDAKFSGLFQFEGAAQRRVSLQVPIDDFRKIDHVTALARPGPLGGGAAGHYINRNAGREPVEYKHPSMEAYLGDTFGVVLYQEQVMRIVRELGQFSWEETSVIRKAMSGRKGKEFFDQRGAVFAQGAAAQGISAEQAADIWNEICSFGAWGMNKSHTTSYAVISYWCAWMKCYHPLEYAAACLRSAKDDEQTVEILRELAAEGVGFVPFDLDRSEQDWSVQDGKLVGGFKNLVGVGPVKAGAYVSKRRAGALTEKDRAAIAKCRVKNDDLRPAHTRWGDLYANPADHGIAGPVREFAELADGENGVVVCRMIRRERRDENETVRLARRGGERKAGQTEFLDMFVVDDSVSKPVVLRIRPKAWARWGLPVADRAVDGAEWFLVRGRWLGQFSMMIVEKIRCLTTPELFDGPQD